MDNLRAALVREVYDRFNHADIDGLIALLDPDIEMPDPLKGTTLKGKEAVRRYWERVFEVADHSVIVNEIIEVGDAVIVVTFSEAFEREGGAPLGQGMVAVHRLSFRGDRIVAIEYTGVDEVPEQVRERLG